MEEIRYAFGYRIQWTTEWKTYFKRYFHKFVVKKFFDTNIDLQKGFGIS